MKPRTSTDKRVLILPFLWFLLHLAAIIPGPVIHRPVLTGDLYSLLPDDRSAPEALRRANRAFTARNDSILYILAGHAGLDEARQGATLLAEQLDPHPAVISTRFRLEQSTYLRDAERFLFDHRFLLQDRETLRRLREGRGAILAEEALAAVFSTFSFSSLENLDRDPFLLTEATLQSFLRTALRSGGALTITDDVLTAEFEGRHYVLITVELDHDALSITGRAEVIPAVYAAQDRVSQRIDGIRWVNSGVPFHTYESSRRAQREILFITVISLTAVIVLLSLSFRSIALPVVTAGVIAAGATTAFSVTLLVFREIHVFTLAFGTSLIGISIDYILHFFAADRRKGLPEKEVIRGINLGLVTTLVSYAFLSVAPFPVLRQIAVFSSTGLLSVYGSVRLLFPAVSRRIGPPVPSALQIPGMLTRLRLRARTFSGTVRIGSTVLIALAAIPGIAQISSGTDLRDLYTMSDTLLESERVAAEVLRSGADGRYIIVAGDTAEDLLIAEEALTERLDGAVSSGQLGSYLAVSAFVPSRRQQRETYELIGEELLPLVERQWEYLGFPPEEREILKRNLEEEYRDARGRVIEPDAVLSQSFAEAIRRLWLGTVGDRYFSVVMPFNVDDAALLRSIAEESDRAYYVDTVADINRSLDGVSRFSIVLVAAAYLAILALLSLVYTPVLALKISAVPAAAAILTVAVSGYAGRTLSFFFLMGIILAMGIGIDYAIFLTERPERRENTFFAVFLSMVTTLLSFGTLSLSSFTPVAHFGFAVLWGVAFAFVLAVPLGSDRS